jgi:protein-disulfide isomerase
MKARLGAGAALMALLVTGCGGGSDSGGNNVATANSNAPVPAIAAPNGGNWVETVQATAEGYRMGNPNAPVQLVEYASITCPHCGEFEEAGGEELRELVRSGQVSWEYRPYMIFPTDPAIFMLLRCQGATPFFRLTQQLYADQANWTGRLRSLPEAQLQQIQALPPQQQQAAVIRATGLDQFFRQRGMPEGRINSCLADQQQLQQLSAVTERGSREENITGTPSFIINGELATGVDTPPYWPQLEPLIRARIGG